MNIKDYIKHLPYFRKRKAVKNYPSTRLQMKYVFAESDNKSPLIQLPNDFSEVRYREGLEGKWLELINSSKEFDVWNIDLLERQILRDLVFQGGILISNGEQFVACASICERDEFQPNALLMYVIVKNEYRKLGLGKYVTAQAMSTARCLGYPGIVLRTDDYRIPAVKMYFQFGFSYDPVPGLYSRTKWNILKNKIKK